ncbi:pyruvate kinase [Bradyrhizobium jicamae]|uniref:Pyruvate kinase n=1 Tax=Bradyrhizobium jicamae TaxID=280332 RepID=A0ABS5FUJ7_9BRAD|nr:pyruvate kinase [Bradyrhizobium jicamae]MBR0800443.1 pyruvate kinase [Bradyrhizobium jicamae]
MRRHRYAKIIATLGPASSDAATIRTLFDEGADVFRFNFSHGSHAEHLARYEIVRAIEKETRRPIAVLADLQGPKLRIGKLADGSIELVNGEKLRLDLDSAPGTRERIPLPHPEVFAALAPGVQLLIDDGKMRFEVEEASKSVATARVTVGGKLSDRKGLSVVGAVLPMSAMTDKDRTDLAFALKMGADWIALSFVQRPEDLDEARAAAGRPVSLMTKLEKPSAVDRLEEIVARSDAVMIARGDLGVEMPPQKVPTIQRRVLRACRQAGKPVVVATQMLESMITTPTPTRAEASDVATAVYEGADAVMLSAESAAGRFPVEAVRMMNEIITEVERDAHYRRLLDAAHPEPEATVSDVICDALRRSAAILPVAALVTYTAAGKTSLRAARERPAAPIISLTPDLATARRLALVWGVHPVVVRNIERLSEVVNRAFEVTAGEGFAKPGDTIALTGGMPFGVSGGTNLLRIEQLPTATLPNP